MVTNDGGAALTCEEKGKTSCCSFEEDTACLDNNVMANLLCALTMC